MILSYLKAGFEPREHARRFSLFEKAPDFLRATECTAQRATVLVDLPIYEEIRTRIAVPVVIRQSLTVLAMSAGSSSQGQR